MSYTAKDMCKFYRKGIGKVWLDAWIKNYPLGSQVIVRWIGDGEYVYRANPIYLLPEKEKQTIQLNIERMIKEKSKQ